MKVDNSISRIKISTVSFEEVKEDIKSILIKDRPINESYLLWRYDEVFGTPINCLAEINGKKVGLLTFFPRPLKMKEKVVLLADSGHLWVDEEYRRRGISVKLRKRAMAEARQSGIDFFFAMPTEEAKKGSLRTGWEEIGYVRRFTKIINVKPQLKKTLRNSFLSQYLGSILNFFFSLLSAEYLIRCKGYQLEKIIRLDERFNLLWQRASSFTEVARVRDEKFLEWRFLHKPQQNYTYSILGLIKNGELKGYVVLRISFSEAIVVDFFSLKNEIFRLIKKTVSYLRNNQNINSISVGISEKNAYRFAWNLFGFFPTKDRTNICCYISHDKNNSYQIFRDMRNWFVTWADKDTV